MESNYTLSNEEKALAKIYKEPELVQFFQQAFSKGIALDCVDVHDRRKDPDLDKTERYIYDCADKALDLIDLDDLYDKAEDLNIDITYPEFYSFLNEKIMGLNEHELSDGSGGLLSDSDDEDGDGIEQDEDGDEKELSLGDSVAKGLFGGEHTGQESFNNKYKKSDEYREMLNEEQRQKNGGYDPNQVLKDSKEQNKTIGKNSSEDVTHSLHTGEKNANDVTNVIKGTQAEDSEKKHSAVEVRKINNENKKKQSSKNTLTQNVKPTPDNITDESGPEPEHIEHKTQDGGTQPVAAPGSSRGDTTKTIAESVTESVTESNKDGAGGGQQNHGITDSPAFAGTDNTIEGKEVRTSYETAGQNEVIQNNRNDGTPEIFSNRQNDKIKKGDSKKVEKITSSHDNIVSGDSNKVSGTKRGNVIRNGAGGTDNTVKPGKNQSVIGSVVPKKDENKQNKSKVTPKNLAQENAAKSEAAKKIAEKRKIEKKTAEKNIEEAKRNNVIAEHTLTRGDFEISADGKIHTSQIKKRSEAIANAAVGNIDTGIYAGGITLKELQSVSNAIGNGHGPDFITNREIADSYVNAGQVDAETTRIISERSSAAGTNAGQELNFFSKEADDFEKNAWNPEKKESKNTEKVITGHKKSEDVISGRENSSIITGKNNDNTVNVGIMAKRSGNQVTLLINNNPKKYTIRSNGTINVDGSELNIYRIDDDRVFAGWKDAIQNKDKIITSDGRELNVSTDGKHIDEFSGLDIKVHSKRNIQEQKDAKALDSSAADFDKLADGNMTGNEGISSSFAKGLMPGTGASGEDFSEIDGVFTTDSYAEKRKGKSVDQLLRKTEFEKNIKKQGFMLHLVLHKKAMNKMKDIKFSGEDISCLASNYNKILALNCRDAGYIAKMNKALEKKYVSKEDRNKLKELRETLSKDGLSTDSDVLKDKLANGSLSVDQAKTADEYTKLYAKTREDIIKNGILVKNTNTMQGNRRIEDGFFAASMPVLMESNGLPSSKVAIAKLIESNRLTEKQRKLITNYLKVKSADKLLKTAGRVKNATVGAARKVKSFANKHMGNDYTMRGLLMVAGVVTAPVLAAKKAIHIVKKSRRLAKNTIKLATSIARAGKAAVKATAHMGRAIAKHGLKGAASGMLSKVWLRRTKLKGVKPVRRGVLKTIKKTAVKAVKVLIKLIIRILQLLASTIIAILGPIIFAILLAMLVIFTILSFIKNSGDTIYYESGDIDSDRVMQEMVDVLTLCHASFRDALNNQFGGGGGIAGGTASGTDSMNAPQMKKGDCSKVQGAYRVTEGSWWNYEGSIDSFSWTDDCARIYNKLNSENILSSSGGYAVAKYGDKTVFIAAMGTFWGNDGDILKVKFNKPIALGNESATDEIYVLKFDTKYWGDTDYPEYADGIYGHPMNDGHTIWDMLEFLGKNGSPTNMNSKGYIPVEATNLGNILDGTCDMATIGISSGSSSSVSTNASIIYRQEVTQSTYADILNKENNIYSTYPEEQEVPDGITPTPKPAKESETVYSFYNNNQELISMVLAMFDFEINPSTSLKDTVVAKNDTTASDKDNHKDRINEAFAKGVTSKINDDTWRLVDYFDSLGLDLNNYTEGGYDDLRYSILVGLFNATHIVTGTKVLEYHEGPDGTINPEYNDDGRIIGQNNTDGKVTLVQRTAIRYVGYIDKNGNPQVRKEPYDVYDADGNPVYDERYSPCPGHTKYSAAVITLHYDSLFDIKTWWKENIYDVDDFDKENPNYSSDDGKDNNYHMKDTVLKQTYQYIKKPDFYKSISGTCSAAESSPSSLSPGTPSGTEKENAKKVYDYLINTMDLDEVQAIGVMVNIMRESHFDCTALNSSGAYGICQWLDGRRDALQEWCESSSNPHYDYATLDGQLDYLKATFGSYRNDWTGDGVTGFYRCTNEAEAVEYFLRYYERPGKDDMANRIASISTDITYVKNLLS
mgnify:CR=1 FL=1